MCIYVGARIFRLFLAQEEKKSVTALVRGAGVVLDVCIKEVSCTLTHALFLSALQITLRRALLTRLECLLPQKYGHHLGMSL